MAELKVGLCRMAVYHSAITAYWDDDARQRFDVPRDKVWAECRNLLQLN